MPGSIIKSVLATARSAKTAQAGSSGRIGIVDIGSNTVRLVVYDAPTRIPFPIFNEKATCALGRGMQDSGRLNPEGVEMAKQTLARYVELGQSMGVDHLELVATAAVRDAEDGADFVADIEKQVGVTVQVLSGAEEAKLAAMGLLSGVRDADGILGDLGGGSLDLVALDTGRFGEYATMPLGHLSLPERSGGNLGRANGIVAEELAGISWLPELRGRTFYAVGGTWRSVARIFIEQTQYPLLVLDNYTIGRTEALRMLRPISKMGAKSMEKMGVSSRRTEAIPYAAMVLGALLEIGQPKNLVFSAFGMREGQMMKNLPPEMRDQDPLISGCMSLSERTGRFAIGGEEIHDWMSPLFPDEADEYSRLRLAASMLSDIGWGEHPDYRAEHSFYRALRIPFAGITHEDRVRIALAVFIRYNGDQEDPRVASVRQLLDDRVDARVQTVGLGLRLAHTISGSAPGLLKQARLNLEDKHLVLEVPDGRSVFFSDAIRRRFKTLARSLGRKAKIETY